MSAIMKKSCDRKWKTKLKPITPPRTKVGFGPPRLGRFLYIRLNDDLRHSMEKLMREKKFRNRSETARCVLEWAIENGVGR